jgi:hypothetical protein
VQAVIQASADTALPDEVRLVGPPYAYYFPEPGSDVSALADDTVSLSHRDAATAVHVEIEKASASGAQSALRDEQALVAGD